MALFFAAWPKNIGDHHSVGLLCRSHILFQNAAAVEKVPVVVVVDWFGSPAAVAVVMKGGLAVEVEDRFDTHVSAPVRSDIHELLLVAGLGEVVLRNCWPNDSEHRSAAVDTAEDNVDPPD